MTVVGEARILSFCFRCELLGLFLPRSEMGVIVPPMSIADAVGVDRFVIHFDRG
jgi:hypothetical protein